MTGRHVAGHATYPTDVRHIVGEVKGPTTFGSLVVATDAVYDPATDRTVVEFGTLTDADHETIARTGKARLDVRATP